MAGRRQQQQQQQALPAMMAWGAEMRCQCSRPIPSRGKRSSRRIAAIVTMANSLWAALVGRCWAALGPWSLGWAHSAAGHGLAAAESIGHKAPWHGIAGDDTGVGDDTDGAVGAWQWGRCLRCVVAAVVPVRTLWRDGAVLPRWRRWSGTDDDDDDGAAAAGGVSG